MIVAILGDIAGSRFEFAGNRKKPEVLFAPGCFPTDDTWLSEAVAYALNNSFRKKKATLEQLVLKETIYAFIHHPDDRGVRYFLIKVCDKFPDKFPRLEQMPFTRPIR